MRFVRPIIAVAALLATPSAIAQQQPATPANFDIRVSAALRNDLAGTLIRMQQMGACDIACHIVIARTLVAIDSATPVEMPKIEPADKN